MKRSVFILVFAFVFISAGVAMALDIGLPSGNISGTKTEKVTRMATKKGVEMAINNKLKNEQCAFTDDKTSNQVKCKSGGLDRVVAYLGDWRKGLEATIANNVNVSINADAKDSALANKRASYVESQIKKQFGYWHYYVNGNKNGDNKVGISVSVK